MNGSAADRVHGPSLSFIQWRIQGRSPGGMTPLLFLDKNEARRVEKIFWETAPPLFKGLDDRPPFISRSGSGIVIYHPNYYNTSPMLSLFAVMAEQRQRGINLNTFYFSKYINSHDSFYWQIFQKPLTLDIDLRLYKRTFYESFETFR